MVYGQAGDYRSAEKYASDAMQRAEAANDAYQRTLASHEAAGREEPAARTLNNIGLVHQERGDFRSALEFYLRSLAIKERVSPPDDVISPIGNIGSV